MVKVYRFEFWLIFRYNSLPTKFPVEPNNLIIVRLKEYEHLTQILMENYKIIRSERFAMLYHLYLQNHLEAIKYFQH